MIIHLIVLLLIISAGILLTIHHIKRFRAVEKKTPYTAALHITSIVALASMWVNPILYSLATLNERINANLPFLHQIVIYIASVLLAIGVTLYLLDKRAQRSLK